MANILVTGGAGFVGGHVARRLASNPENTVVVADNLLTGSRDKVPQGPNVVFHEIDANKRDLLEPLFAKYQFDYIFHYAAVVGVRRTLEHPLMVLDDIKGFESICDLAIKFKTKRIFFSSSSEVYGESTVFPQHEDNTPLNARLPYAIVKSVGEAYLDSYHQERGLEYTIFRFFNTYGPGQSEDFVMSRFIAAALQDKDITIYGDGTQTRTFCYIEDNLDATVGALEKNAWVNDVVNIGNSIETDMNTLAATVVKATGSKSKIVHLPPRKKGDMERRQPDNTKMREFLGRELTPLEQGIEYLIEAYRHEHQLTHA